MTKDALLTVAPEPVREETTTRRWSAATRIAFRFCFVYFGLYVLTTQMFGGLIAYLIGVSAWSARQGGTRTAVARRSLGAMEFGK